MTLSVPTLVKPGAPERQARARKADRGGSPIQAVPHPPRALRRALAQASVLSPSDLAVVAYRGGYWLAHPDGRWRICVDAELALALTAALAELDRETDPARPETELPII
ncbi:MAG: hypothetical protein ACYCVN_12400 [Acidimicrobiales bacterium]